MVRDVGEDVQGIRHTMEVALLAAQGKRGLDVCLRFVVPAESRGVVPQIDECHAFRGRVAEAPVETQGEGGMLERPLVIAATLQGPRQSSMGPRLAVPISDVFGEGEGLAEVVKRLVQPAQPAKRLTEILTGIYLDLGLAEVVCGERRGLPRGQVVLRIPPPIVEDDQNCGELPYGLVPPYCRGSLLACQQTLMLGGEPFPGRSAVGEC